MGYRAKNERILFRCILMLTARYDNYAREYGYGGHDFLPAQSVHSNADANDNGNYGLHVGVHTDERWA